jgi:hypothetical protein
VVAAVVVQLLQEVQQLLLLLLLAQVETVQHQPYLEVALLMLEVAAVVLMVVGQHLGLEELVAEVRAVNQQAQLQLKMV